MHDPVDHPAHYTSHPSGVECIEISRWMCSDLGQAFQYIWRCGDKANTLEDLRKAQWFIRDAEVLVKSGWVQSAQPPMWPEAKLHAVLDHFNVHRRMALKNICAASFYDFRIRAQIDYLNYAYTNLAREISRLEAGCAA